MGKKISPVYKIFLWIYAVFYILAGCNHFISTEVYYAIMPQWLPSPKFLIYLSGIAEIILGILLLISKTRRLAALLIMLMLLAFLPVHFYMIEQAPFQLGRIYITSFIAWMRLPLQVFFIGWAAYYWRPDSIKSHGTKK